MKQPNNTMIYNTALYLRLSRDDELQGESGSIQTQRMMLRQYAEEHGLTVVGEYIDDGWSGTNFDRPGFQRMIDDIEEGKINCVVTKDLSRLGRNYILTGQYTEIYFPSKGIRYIAVNDNVDTLNGESELAPFLNILNEMHARQTSKKVKAAMRTRFANGAHYGAYAPLGYIKDPDKSGHLLVDPETKWIIEKIFDLAVHGHGAAYIRSYIFDCLFAGIQFSFSGYFCAWGKSGLSFLHNTLSILLVRVPGAWLACRFFPQTLVPMGLAPACGSLFSSVVCVLLYRWMKRQARRHECGQERLCSAKR